jgi:hypothetical protein
MRRNIRSRSIGRWPWCAMCGGNIRSIRYPIERVEFCTKHCLDRYLEDRASPRQNDLRIRNGLKRVARSGTVEPVPYSSR